MAWKYQKEIENISNCPPDNYEEKYKIAFRWVFKEVNHPNNFRPPLAIEPTRINKGQFKNNPEKICEGHALSLYDTVDNARASYLMLKKRRRKIEQTLGTHIAKGVIAKTNGVVSERDKYGHFNLHEYENIDLKSKFEWIAAHY
jgi:hypothetical protein